MKANGVFSLVAALLFTLPAVAQTNLLEGIETFSNDNPNFVAEELGLNNVHSELTQKDASRKRLKIIIDKAHHRKGDPETSQSLQIYDNGIFIFETKVSTGRETPEKSTDGTEYFSDTPEGTYGITRRHIDYKSKQWDADMPYAQFFVRGVAIHAAADKYVPKLGTRASGGCVRVTLEDAKFIWDLVDQVGTKNVSITVYDSTKTGALKPFDLRKYSPLDLYDENGDALLIY